VAEKATEQAASCSGPSADGQPGKPPVSVFFPHPPNLQGRPQPAHTMPDSATLESKRVFDFNKKDSGIR